MPSIKHNPAGQLLPDFRNFGVMLRILLTSTCSRWARRAGAERRRHRLAAALCRNGRLELQPLLCNMALLALLAPVLRMLRRAWGS